MTFDERVEMHFENSLGIRSKKALLKYFNHKLPDETEIFYELILSEFQPLKLRNIGIKTSLEIQKFIDNTVEIYYQYND